MATKKPHLRVVSVDSKAPKTAKRRKAPESLGEALHGDRWQFLAAMRADLVEKIERGEIASNAIATTFKELRELDRLMRAEERAEGGHGDDDLADEDFDPLAI